MDYEKKYKNALEWARQVMNGETGFIRKEVEEVFPELKESEDEKIRKAIITHFENIHKREKLESFYGVDIEPILAWLEKQKAIDVLDEEEREFADNVDSYRKEIDAAYQKGYNEGVKATLEKQVSACLSHDDEIMIEQLTEYFTTGHGLQNTNETVVAWLNDVKEKLKKQGEDKKEMNNFDVLPGLYKCVHRMFDGTPDGKLLFEVGNIYKCLSKHDRAEFEVSYVHSVYLEDPVVCKHFIPFEKQGEQKSTDDLTQQEAMDIAVAKCFEQGDHNALTEFERTLADICIGWIGEEYGWKQYIKDNADVLLKIAIKKFNSVQDASFEQKSAWSEEDEITRKALINLVEMYYGGCFDKTEKNRLLNFLKSIRPQNHWKPSDEQMEALKGVQDGVFRLSILQSLYDDLLKLTK